MHYIRIDTQKSSMTIWHQVTTISLALFLAFSHYYRCASFLYMFTMHTKPVVVVTLLCSLYVMPRFFSFIVIYWLWQWFLFFFLSFVHHFCLQINILCRKRECWSVNWMNRMNIWMKEENNTNKQNFFLLNISRE